LSSGDPIRKIYVDGVGARILTERVEYLDENGKLVTETLRDFTKTALKKRFAGLDDSSSAGSRPSASRRPSRNSKLRACRSIPSPRSLAKT
jgi:hypothetical protein